MGCKTPGGDLFYLPRVLFPFSINGPQGEPFFCLSFLFYFFFFFYLPVEWKRVTKRFPVVRLDVGGGLPGERLQQSV